MKKVIMIFAASIFSTSVYAMPGGMSEACQQQYEKYAAKSGPKAFSKGSTNGCGWASGKDVKKRAISFCNAHGGRKCRIVEFAE
jgi:hypothetical protein